VQLITVADDRIIVNVKHRLVMLHSTFG